jgi:hypothetical protein
MSSVSELSGAFDHAGLASAAGDGATKASESVDGVFAQVHAGELRGRAGGLGQAVAQRVRLGLRLPQALLHFAVVPRQEHDERHGDEEKCDRRQDPEVSHRCFHDRLPGTIAVRLAPGHAVDCHDSPCCQYAPADAAGQGSGGRIFSTAGPEAACGNRPTYGTMGGMEKTTVYLPDDLKLALRRAARSTGRSEADLIREGIGLVTGTHRIAEARLPIFESGQPDLAERADELLAGFGDR